VGPVIVAGTALAVLLTTCAPNVAPSTMAAIVAVESAGNFYALNDNTSHRSYAPRDYANALGTAQALIRQGHSVDVGIAQVNSGNFTAFHTTAGQMLYACQNLHVASSILADNYAEARTVFPEPARALWHAISAYNTGSLYAGKTYVDRVVAAATRETRVPSIALLTGESVKDRSAVIAVRASSKTVRRMVRKVRLNGFAFAEPNSKNLVITSSSLRHDDSAGARN
jgi:type IV secretion system protein VirB1